MWVGGSCMFYVRSRDQNLRLSSIHAQIETKILNSQAFRWWLPGWTQRNPDVVQPSYPTNVKKLCVVKGYWHALAVFSLTQKKYLWPQTPLTTQKNSILSKSTFCSTKSTFFWVFSVFLGVKGCVVMGSSVVNPVYHHQIIHTPTYIVSCTVSHWL